MNPLHHLAASLGLLFIVLGIALALGQVEGFAVTQRLGENSDERAMDNPSTLTTSQGARHVKPHAQDIKQILL